jgi:nucleotide-binding universal stress UspA family protein
VEEGLEATATRYLEGVKTRLAGEDVRATSLMLRGHPATRIIDHAQETERILVVMSTHGRTGMKRWLLGSVADRVVRRSHRPTLLIRPEAVRIEIRG